MAGCPDRRAHLRAAAQAERIRREIADLDRRIAGRTDSVAKRFDQVLGLLGRWGHLDGWTVTERGRVLARLYHETDLLVAEALVRGLLDDLDAERAGRRRLVLHLRAPEQVAAAAAVVPVSRGSTAGSSPSRRSLGGSTPTRSGPDCPSPACPIRRSCRWPRAWAAGESFDTVLADEELSGGDFVRNVKQLIDLLRQIAEVAPLLDTRPSGARGRRSAVPGRRGCVVGGRQRQTSRGARARRRRSTPPLP